MITVKLGFLFALVAFTSGLYSSDDDVIELTSSNFKSEVLDSDELWLVEFYAPWCGHCKNLAPEWIKAAGELKGVVNIGAVDMTLHESVGRPYGIAGFPTIKVFAYNKGSPKDYQGGRLADKIVDYALKELRQMVKDRSSGGKKSGGGGGGGGGGQRDSGENHVITLTDSNFKELVLDSNEPWLVEFYAPWCGHCKRLEPVWKSVAKELKEKVGDAVKMGALDATAHGQMASRYGVRGYPTIKIFRKGEKQTPQDFEGGRDHSSILTTAMELYEENIEPPKINELTSATVLEENCVSKQLCIIAFLPDILDTGADRRNDLLELLSKIGNHYRKKIWGWMWTEALKQPELEKGLEVGGSGYPAMAIIVDKKKLYSVLTGPFTEEGIMSFLRDLEIGRGGLNSNSLKDSKLPTVVDSEPWDGKDGQLPEEEDIDLSEFKWDDEL